MYVVSYRIVSLNLTRRFSFFSTLQLNLGFLKIYKILPSLPFFIKNSYTVDGYFFFVLLAWHRWNRTARKSKVDNWTSEPIDVSLDIMQNAARPTRSKTKNRKACLFNNGPWLCKLLHLLIVETLGLEKQKEKKQMRGSQNTADTSWSPITVTQTFFIPQTA